MDWAADVRHVGPMAQDFQAAFGLNGSDDKHISVVDESGVALAAIQGLNQKLEETRAELKRRDVENAELKARLEKIEQRLNEKSQQRALICPPCSPFPEIPLRVRNRSPSRCRLARRLRLLTRQVTCPVLE
jgi:septal ring factor EnvC (AmiA/AmiB activator)